MMENSSALARALTNLADDLVVFQSTPGNVDTVIVPVGPGHMRVHIGIDPRHDRMMVSETCPHSRWLVKLRRAG